MNISTVYGTRLLFQMFFAVRLHVLLADFLLFVIRPTDTPHRTMIYIILSPSLSVHAVS